MVERTRGVFVSHTFLLSTSALLHAMSAAGATSVPVPCGAVHGGATGATPRAGPVLTGVGYDVRVITVDVMMYFVTSVRSSPLHVYS